MIFVLATSQALQVALVAIVAGLIFFVLGLILLSPALLAQWTRNGPGDGQILGMTLVTHQTGPEGRLVQRLLIEETLPIERELYLGIVLDRTSGKNVFMASAEGGMEI